MCILMCNAYPSNSCGKDKCVRLCKYKECKNKHQNWQPVSWEGPLFCFFFLGNFSVCMELLFPLNTQTDCDFSWLVDKTLPKCAVFLFYFFLLALSIISMIKISSWWKSIIFKNQLKTFWQVSIKDITEYLHWQAAIRLCFYAAYLTD